jgi:hypothetical protein
MLIATQLRSREHNAAVPARLRFCYGWRLARRAAGWLPCTRMIPRDLWRWLGCR